MALWTSQMEDHTSDWLKTVLIYGLGRTMTVPIYRLDHAVSCAEIISIKHRHNIVRDTLVDICYRSGISAGTVDFIRGRAVIDYAQRKRGKYMDSGSGSSGGGIGGGNGGGSGGSSDGSSGGSSDSNNKSGVFIFHRDLCHVPSKSFLVRHLRILIRSKKIKLRLAP
uniref:Uncharacterized protein n=1 Tax=Tanacetum cinerariifolium TaxID=118510 RepID=A0A6L2MGF0_TANCI|nr:hypothetical protein [Tanacetum cinerariifolium]